jgi:hypothetical protein
MTKRVGKYGMKFSTIRSWQQSAIDYVKYNDNRGVFQRSLQYRLGGDMMTTSNRVIAYAAIQCAAVCHPAAVKAAIKGA